MKISSLFLCAVLAIITSCGEKKSEEIASTDSVSESPVLEEISNNANSETYSTITENTFQATSEKPISTFSIDVDHASYSNTRRYIKGGSLPPVDAIRVEEFINYFTYDYPQPKNDDSFSINTSVSTCPWNKEHLLVQIGLQGKKVDYDKLPKSNIVFLIDASGSMEDANKLPLLKKSIKLMVAKMQKEDRISLVVYAGAAGEVLPSTSVCEKTNVNKPIKNLVKMQRNLYF